MPREIPLSKGQVAIVDDADYEWLTQWKWCAMWNPYTRSFYAWRNARAEGRQRTIYMHRVILGLGAGDKRQGDHIESGRTLDNQRSNLRIATRAENMRNARTPRSSTTGIKGVHLDVSRKTPKWVAAIRVNGRICHLGRFLTPHEAQAAYAQAAKLHYGEFARTS